MNWDPSTEILKGFFYPLSPQKSITWSRETVPLIFAFAVFIFFGIHTAHWIMSPLRVIHCPKNNVNPAATQGDHCPKNNVNPVAPQGHTDPRVMWILLPLRVPTLPQKWGESCCPSGSLHCPKTNVNSAALQDHYTVLETMWILLPSGSQNFPKTNVNPSAPHDH